MTNTFWIQYFQQLFSEGESWLDYSNGHVQIQTYAAALEAAGIIAGQRCLDAGCGKGQFSAALSVLDAGAVVGVDMVETAIKDHRQKYPKVQWSSGNLLDATFREKLGIFDRIFLIEALQYMPVQETLPALWSMLHKNGRLVVIFPNKECPIVRKVAERFVGNYNPPVLQEIENVLKSLPQIETWAFRSFFFRKNQSLTPYKISEWARGIKQSPPPNRILLMVQKI